MPCERDQERPSFRMTQYRYYRGHISRTWDDSFKLLEYQYLPHRDDEMVQRWLDQGYPRSLTLNGEVHHLRDRIPDYAKPLCDQLGWKDIGCQLYRMNQGDIIPVHQDHYSVYKKIVGTDRSDQVWRAVMFMEDWKSGHCFEIDGRPWSEWKAGDYMVWNNDVPHMAANIGIEPRYTLQITGWI
jgi:hypothetical protein